MTSDILTEQESIALILSDRNYYDTAISRHGITENSYTDEVCKSIFTQVGTLIRKNETPELFSIDIPFDVKNYLIKRIPEIFYTSEEVDSIFEKVKRMEILRDAKEKIDGIKSLLESKNETVGVNEIADMLENTVDSMSNYLSSSRIETMDDVVEKIKSYIETNKSTLSLFGEGTVPDKAFRLHSGETMVLCGNTGTGKTALAAEWAINLAYSGKRVLYVCTESSDVDIFLRMSSTVCGIPHWEVRDPTYRGALLRYTYIGVARELNGRIFLHCLKKHKPSVESIERTIFGIEKEYGNVDALFIDYIQDIGYPKSIERLQERERIEIVTDRLHDMCISHGIAGIYLSQLNRTGERDTPPGNEQIKSAGKIAEKAHIVAFIWRKRSVISEDKSEDAVKDDAVGSGFGKNEKVENEDNTALFYSTKCRNTKSFNLKLSYSDGRYIALGEEPDNYPMCKLIWKAVPNIATETFAQDKYYYNTPEYIHNIQKTSQNQQNAMNPDDASFRPFSGYSYLNTNRK